MAVVTAGSAAMETQEEMPASVQGAQSADQVPADVADAPQPAASESVEPEEAKVEKVTCRRCNEEVNSQDALCQEKFRADLRWTCKACHAVLTQLNRHGVDLKSALSESESVSFFQDCKVARMNAVDKRLSYTQARGILKQSMIACLDRRGDRRVSAVELLGAQGVQH